MYVIGQQVEFGPGLFASVVGILTVPQYIVILFDGKGYCAFTVDEQDYGLYYVGSEEWTDMASVVSDIGQCLAGR
jgi:hypothetical protein